MKNALRATAALALFLVALCVLTYFRPRLIVRVPRENKNTQQSVETFQAAPYERYGVYGIPQYEKPLTLLTNIGYAVGFDETIRAPRWCAYRLSEMLFDEPYERHPEWFTDRRVQGCPEPTDYQYKISKKHRGHLAPSYAMFRSYGTIGMIESFSMTNAVPMSPQLNTGIWASLEERVFGQKDSWANQDFETWIICGPIYREPIQTIGNNIRLPSAFFKIIVRDENNKRPDVSQCEFYSFIIPESPELLEKKDYMDFVCSVDDIESLTGLDFFVELSDELEIAFEEARFTER